MRLRLLIVTLALLITSLSTCPGLAESAKRPNILFILVDDQSPFDFKFYNPASTLNAPNIERLAREGMVFDGAYHLSLIHI